MALEARLEWQSEISRQVVIHGDRLVVNDSALQASGRFLAAGKLMAERGEAELDPAPWCQPRDQGPVVLPAEDFRLHAPPVPGRFYPRLAFASLAQGGRDLRPVRLLAREDGQLRVDPNHPLAGTGARMFLRSTALEAAPGLRLAELFDGPGIQHPPAEAASAYLAPEGFECQDGACDALFYAEPRFTHHLDAACRAEIEGLYGRFLRPGMAVLDLMSSWTSHLPEQAAEMHVAGLGMNQAELAANGRLSERVVKDLNERSGLPWSDAQFDLALCTASIEYLLRPAEVMAEVKRVLKPGGVFVVSFSDRWFPSKAVRIWSELHPFERLALVLSLFVQAGFSELHTETLRGVKRPVDDKYADQRGFSDPLFAVWGAKPPLAQR